MCFPATTCYFAASSRQPPKLRPFGWFLSARNNIHKWHSSGRLPAFRGTLSNFIRMLDRRNLAQSFSLDTHSLQSKEAHQPSPFGPRSSPRAIMSFRGEEDRFGRLACAASSSADAQGSRVYCYHLAASILNEQNALQLVRNDLDELHVWRAELS